MISTRLVKRLSSNLAKTRLISQELDPPFWSTKDLDQLLSQANPLYDVLASKIREDGFITFAEYVAESNSHPEHGRSDQGYYTRNEVFNQEGDFTTSVEVSRLFGEMVSLFFLNHWDRAGNLGSARM